MSTAPHTRIVHTPDGIRLAATYLGHGPVTLVYVHGLLADASFWGPLAEYLNTRTAGSVRQVAYDARGHGRSARPDHRANTDFGTLAADLACVITSIRGPVVLVAHSVGCFVALEYARFHHEQLRDRIAEVVLFAGSGEQFAWPALKRLAPAAAAVRWMRRRGPLDAINAAGHRYLSRRLCQQASHAKPGRAQLIPSDYPVDPRVTADICTNVVRARLDPATVTALAGVPVRLVVAERDKVVPAAQTQHLADRLRSASVEHIPDTGHSMPMLTPSAAAPAILAAISSTLASAVPHRTETTPTVPVDAAAAPLAGGAR